MEVVSAYADAERELKASGDLFPSVISHGNPYGGLAPPESRTHADIDRYSPIDLCPDRNSREHAELAAALERRNARLTPIEEAVDQAGGSRQTR